MLALGLPQYTQTPLSEAPPLHTSDAFPSLPCTTYDCWPNLDMWDTIGQGSLFENSEPQSREGSTCSLYHSATSIKDEEELDQRVDTLNAFGTPKIHISEDKESAICFKTSLLSGVDALDFTFLDSHDASLGEVISQYLAQGEDTNY